MSEHKKSKKFLPKISYPGGIAALKKFIGSEMKYPKEALQNKIEGIVRIKISIDYKGKVTDSKVIKSLGYGCDEEAGRIVSLMQWEPDKKLRKGKILFHKTLNIHFKPSRAKKTIKRVQTQVKYSITTSQSKSQSEPKPSKSNNSGSYTYTINY